jgi:hypothetical protein
VTYLLHLHVLTLTMGLFHLPRAVAASLDDTPNENSPAT